MSHSDISDPKKCGPGIWYTTHVYARDAVTEEKKHIFLNHINMLRKDFPCEKCRGHINEYVEANPIEHYWNVTDNDGNAIGLFQWSWIFHNAVNERINKERPDDPHPYVDWNTAYNMYYNTDIMICTKGCEESTSQQSEQEVTPSISYNPNYFSFMRALSESNTRYNPSRGSQNVMSYTPQLSNSYVNTIDSRQQYVVNAESSKLSRHTDMWNVTKGGSDSRVPSKYSANSSDTRGVSKLPKIKYSAPSF